MTDKKKDTSLLNEIEGLRKRVEELEAFERNSKKSPENLVLEGDQYRKLLDQLPQMVFETDIEGKIIYMNSAGLSSTGFDTADIEKGVNCHEIMVPEDRDRAEKNFSDRLSGRDMGWQEYTGMNRDGKTIPILIYSSAVVRNNAISGICGIVIDITDRKRLLEELRDSEERLEILFKYAPDAYYLIDLNGTFIDGNLAAQNIIGYSKEEIIGHNAVEIRLVPNGHVNTLIKLLRKHRKGQPSGPDELTMIHKNGHEVIVEVMTYPVTIKGEKLVLGIARDVTERKKTDLRLKISEERYRSLFDRSLDGVIILDLEGNFFDANPAALDMVDYPAEELAGRSIFSLIEEDDHQRMRPLMNDVIRTGYQRQLVEFRLRRRQGSHIWVEAKGSIIFRDNEPLYYQAIVRDITDRKIVERRLEVSEERYRAIFDRSFDPVFINDLRGNFMDANPAAIELLGIDRKDIGSITFSSLIPREQFHVARRTFREIMETGSMKDMTEYHIITPGGKKRWIETKGSLIYHNDVPYAVLGIARDITERKRIEQYIKQRNEEMEKDLLTAQMIQKAMISSSLPETSLLEIGYRYNPLDAIGGDFFSFRQLQEGGFAVFIGDVVGHGVTAALYLSLVKATTDRICRIYPFSPEKYMIKLNEELFDNMPLSFLTACYGIFERMPKTDRLKFTFASAGHPYPVLYRAADGSVEVLKSQGRILGMLEDINVRERTVELDRGDMVFLFTDGILEMTDEKGNIIGFEKLPSIIQNSVRSSLGETLDTVISECDAYRGKKSVEDDIILIGFKV